MAHGIKVQRRVHVDEICRSFICRCVYFANIGRNVEVTRIARKKKKRLVREIPSSVARPVRSDSIESIARAVRARSTKPKSLASSRAP